MSNGKRAPERQAGAGSKADSDVSGERPAMQDAGYAGMMSLGSEAFRVPLPPPPSEHPRVSPRVRLGMYVVGAAVGIAAAVVGVAIVLTRPAPETPRDDASHADARGAIAAVAPEAVDTAPVKADDVKQPEAAEPARAAMDAPAPAAEPTPTPTAAAPTEPASAANEAPTAKPAESEAKSASSRTRDSGASRARRHQDTSMPAHLSREQVIAGMVRVQPAVAACFSGTRGSAMASITIIGRTGRVTTARVTGQSGLVGSCIARAVRNATFPRFTDETLTVGYPFAH